MLRIGDIARMYDETVTTIRHWCQEFGIPVQRKGGQRIFDWDGRTAISEVHRLLRIEGHTIEGAKRKLGVK